MAPLPWDQVVSFTLKQFLALSEKDREYYISEAYKRGVMENVEHGMNFYLLVLACLSATGAASYGALKWWQFIKSTCTVAFRPSKATSVDMEVFNGPLNEDPQAGAAFDTMVSKKSKSSRAPNPIRNAAKNLQKARSRESSPAGSSRSSGSAGEGPSAPVWKYSTNKLRYREVAVRGKTELEWQRLDSKQQWVRTSDPRTQGK